MTASAICLPTVIVGFSEVSGSWKIMPISLPRTWRIFSSGRLLISRPSSLMLPPTIDPPVGSRFMIDSAVIVLPQPGLAHDAERLAGIDMEVTRRRPRARPPA